MGGAPRWQSQRSQHAGDIVALSGLCSPPSSTFMPLNENSRKRKQTKSPSQSADIENAPTTKRRKISLQNQPRPPQALPHFWDSLSEVRLTRGALREFDHRVLKKQPLAPKPSHPRKVSTFQAQPNILKRLARRGGPDLSRLRGFSTSTMSSRSHSSRKRPSTSGGSARTPNTKPSDSQYRAKIIQAGLYPHGYKYSKGKPDPPDNLNEILQRLADPRPSLSPSRFTEEDFAAFQEDVERADNEDQAWARAMAVVEGRHKHYSMSKSHFNHMNKFREDIADAVPDSYDGAVPETINSRVLCGLDETIIPCNDASRPAAPNFFLEAKRADASPHVAKLQATHNGAIGARAMNELQNYGQATPKYDRNAYTFTNTYHNNAALLQMYTTHPTAPETHGGIPEYHMTQLKAYAMTSDIETFRRGAAAYRNIRDLGAENRDTFIQQANTVAQRMFADTPSSQLARSRMSRSAQAETDSDTSLDELAREEVTVKRSKRVPPRNQNAIHLTGTKNANRVANPRQQPVNASVRQGPIDGGDKLRRASTKISAKSPPS